MQQQPQHQKPPPPQQQLQQQLQQQPSPQPQQQQPQHAALKPAAMDPRKATVRGYKAQAGRVLEHVDRLLSGCEARRQSVVVEGVHLSLRWVWRGLMCGSGRGCMVCGGGASAPPGRWAVQVVWFYSHAP